MPFASSNGIEICYETFGDRDDAPLLLVQGLGASLLGWDEELCAMLVERGRYVIRFDNRDCGLSTRLDGVDVDLPAIMAAWNGEGAMPPVPYTLSTMAADAIGLLDHLGIESAHIVGMSLGGMIVQTMAIEHPSRVRTLTSIMSTTGERDYYLSVPEVRAALLAPRPPGRDGYMRAQIELSRAVSSPRYFDPVVAEVRINANLDRSGEYQEGMMRQTAAIRFSGSRADGLRNLRMPTLVVHGRADPLILPVGGERTAAIVAGANLLLLGDMGHDLPAPLWPLVVDALISHTTHAVGAPDR